MAYVVCGEDSAELPTLCEGRGDSLRLRGEAGSDLDSSVSPNPGQNPSLKTVKVLQSKFQQILI